MRVQTFRARDERGIGLKPAQAVAIGLLVVLAVSLLSALIFVVSSGSSGAAASIVRAQPGAIPWDGRSRLNILLLGLDGRGSGRGTTGSVMLASYDPAGRSLSLISLPGNLWVTVPGFGQARLMDAYNDGGSSLALTVTEGTTDLAVPYYAALGSDATMKLIDAYGGVRLGRTLLDGEAALRYLRSAPSQTASMLRQQRLFLSVLRQALQGQTLLQLPGVINTVGGSVDTNLPYNQVPTIARMLTRVPRARIRTLVVDSASGAVSPYTANGEQVLLPDWQTIHAQVQSLAPAQSYRGRVDVLNGSTLTGAAAGLEGWLRADGLPVQGIGSADSLNYPHTQVVLNTRSHFRADALARAAAALLQAPMVVRDVRETRAPVVVIIGHDYQDPTQQ